MFPFCMERNLFILLFKYSAMKIRYLLIACLFFDFYYSIAQINTTTSNSEESKIFHKNSLEVLQAAYLDKDGMPSYEIFLQKNNLNPFDKKSQSTPFFTISISKDDFTDKNGNKRDRYKMEYVHRENARFITEDYTEGTSEDILISLSPDGSEVEIKVELSGFLKDKYGKKLVQRGQKIDIAVGVEG